MRIVFFGSGEFGLPTLRALMQAHDVRLVISQPDRPAGRNRSLTPTPIAQLALENNLPLLRPEKCNVPDVIQAVRDAKSDANIVIAFGQKVGRELIESPSHGAMATMNLHASILPKYRGAAPIHWAIVRGETVTGNTIFSLVEKMDAGPVLGVQSTPIDPLETTGELHDRLSALGPSLVLDVLTKLEAGALTPQVQDESQATLAPKLSRADAVIDFTKPADEIRCRVHGLTPWPGVTVYYSADPAGPRQPLMLRRVKSIGATLPGGAPGELVSDNAVACGSGQLELLEVQPPGKRQMTWADFARGAKLTRGARFWSQA
jgi:methionyl-tRNA formyltransferase